MEDCHRCYQIRRYIQTLCVDIPPYNMSFVRIKLFKYTNCTAIVHVVIT